MKPLVRSKAHYNFDASGFSESKPLVLMVEQKMFRRCGSGSLALSLAVTMHGSGFTSKTRVVLASRRRNVG